MFDLIIINICCAKVLNIHMIKMEIHILGGELDIEIKQVDDQYLLLVILSKSDYFKENGRAWNGKTMNEPKVREIANLIRDCYKKPSIPKMITINDGRTVKISLKEDKSEISLTIKNIFEEGMIEFQLMQKIFDFINEIIPDAILKKYTLVFG